MKQGTKYITILRVPSAHQWESAFDEFLFEDTFPNASAIPEEDSRIDNFLEKPSYYREIYVFHTKV